MEGKEPHYTKGAREEPVCATSRIQSHEKALLGKATRLDPVLISSKHILPCPPPLPSGLNSCPLLWWEALGANGARVLAPVRLAMVSPGGSCMLLP